VREGRSAQPRAADLWESERLHFLRRRGEARLGFEEARDHRGPYSSGMRSSPYRKRSFPISIRTPPKISVIFGKWPSAICAAAKSMFTGFSLAAWQSAWPKTKSSTMASTVSFCFAVIDVPARPSRQCSMWRIALSVSVQPAPFTKDRLCREEVFSLSAACYAVLRHPPQRVRSFSAAPLPDWLRSNSNNKSKNS